MSEDVYTPAGYPVSFVRNVGTYSAQPERARTADGNPIQPVRFYSGSGSSGSATTTGGFPIMMVRDVTGGAGSPEKVWTDDGRPILFVKYDDGVIPERSLTPGGNPITIVQQVNDSGSLLPPAVSQWATAVIANGGTVSAARQAIVSSFIAAEIAAGSWALTDDYWPLWGENAPQGLTSLKQRRLATVVAAPTFTVDRGYTFNGTTNYIDTGFIPSTHTTTMTPSNMRIAGYERTEVTANTYTAGVASSGTVVLQFRTRLTTSCFANLNSASITYTLPVASSLGYTAFSRNGADASTCFGYKNGSAMVQASSSTFVSTSLPAHAVYIGCQNSVGTASTFRATSVGFLAVGAQLSAAQELAQYNNVQAWATSIGANV